MPQYLVCYRDEPWRSAKPMLVIVSSAEEALNRYLRSVFAKNTVFRDHILDLAINMTFVERFYLSTEHERQRFGASGLMGTEDEIVQSRARQFFNTRPDIGERFVNYMKTEDQSLIDDEVFEFIATNIDAKEHGVIVINLDAIDVLG